MRCLERRQLNTTERQSNTTQLTQGRYFLKKITASGGIRTHDHPLARHRSCICIWQLKLMTIIHSYIHVQILRPAGSVQYVHVDLHVCTLTYYSREEKLIGQWLIKPLVTSVPIDPGTRGLQPTIDPTKEGTMKNKIPLHSQTDLVKVP